MPARILSLVEEPTNANKVSACFEDSEHELVLVNAFDEAIAMLSSQKFDLIICDVHLETDGNVFELLRRVKKGQWTCEIPFVLLNSQPTPMAKYIADALCTTARYLGAVKYIEMEAFDTAQIREIIQSLLVTTRSPTLERCARRSKEPMLRK